MTMDQRPGLAARVSRRAAMVGLARGAAVLTLGPAAACARPATLELSGDGGDDALLARILAAPQPYVPWREKPYRLTRTLPIAGGKTVVIAPATRIIWAGPARSAAGSSIAVFEATGDDTGIRVADGGEAFVECETPSPLVYAVVMRGRRGFAVIGIQARECQHVHIDAAAADYAAVRTQGPGSNIARDVHISGGGARYARLVTEGQGACLLRYVSGCRVDHVHYENVPHGIQWWGGDAGLEPWQNGARANERKCINLTIETASVSQAHVGGIWGSMGRDIVVRDCTVEECHDVGFDAEGCVATSFERCVAHNGHNGCFATFSLCDGVRFIACRGSVDRKEYPLLRVYNMTQSNADNRNLQVIGGHFECRDATGPGTIDSAMGPVREIAITGATLDNVRIDLAFFNMHRTRIAGNTLTFRYPLPSVSAIRAGSSKALTVGGTAVAGGVVIEGNRITYAAHAAPGSPVAIQVREDDFNSNATGRIAGNVVSGPFAAGVSVINATSNAGIVPSFEIQGNRFDGLAARARLLAVTREGPHARLPTVRWDDTQNRNGKATTLQDALG